MPYLSSFPHFIPCAPTPSCPAPHIGPTGIGAQESSSSSPCVEQMSKQESWHLDTAVWLHRGSSPSMNAPPPTSKHEIIRAAGIWSLGSRGLKGLPGGGDHSRTQTGGRCHSSPSRPSPPNLELSLKGQGGRAVPHPPGGREPSSLGEGIRHAASLGLGEAWVRRNILSRRLQSLFQGQQPFRY